MVNDKLKGQSFLRWAGSKKKLLPILKKYVPENYNRYIEPFAGSACLFFALEAPKGILGDINEDLISTFEEIKYRLPDVIRELQRLRKDKQVYYDLRKQETDKLFAAERAARFIYLNRFSFNGIYRTNSRGEFNVPYGGDKAGRLPSPELLTWCSVKLQHIKLVAADFEKTLALCKPRDFVYLDPPFSVRSRRVFREYHKDSFSVVDIARFRESLESLDARRVSFLVSYADSREGRFLARGFISKRLQVKRNISGFANRRRVAYELLITNMKETSRG